MPPGGAVIGKRGCAAADGPQEASDDFERSCLSAQASAGRQSARLATKSRRQTDSSDSLDDPLSTDGSLAKLDPNLAPHFARGKLSSTAGSKAARHSVQGAGINKRKRQESPDALGNAVKSRTSKIGKVDKEHDKYCHFCQVSTQPPPLRSHPTPRSSSLAGSASFCLGASTWWEGGGVHVKPPQIASNLAAI